MQEQQNKPFEVFRFNKHKRGRVLNRNLLSLSYPLPGLENGSLVATASGIRALSLNVSPIQPSICCPSVVGGLSNKQSSVLCWLVDEVEEVK